MFGRRNDEAPVASRAPNSRSEPTRKALPIALAEHIPSEDRSVIFLNNKREITESVLHTMDAGRFNDMAEEEARSELAKNIAEVINQKNLTLTREDRATMTSDIINDVLGCGPLEPLLARDDIADIMVNGIDDVFIETKGKISRTNISFNDEKQLEKICQRMANQAGRRVDLSSPICDARLPDGSRINIILPPLSIRGPSLTIRKFRRDHLRMRNLVEFGAISPEGAELLRIIGRVRCNVIVSGGTGSGKTTLLNCLGEFIDDDERTVTCEDTAELQIQKHHVVSLETRTKNLEGAGEVKMADLVRNCLRMRPDRIIVGEVRSGEAFDLLQAMNTGHDGSMGTLHANSPREAVSRLESMVMMGQSALPSKVIRELIKSSVEIIVQTKRLRDGSRRITHITEVTGMEGDTITLQDIMIFDITGEGAKGAILGHHASTGVMQPKMIERARYFREDANLVAALQNAPKSKK
ncbi:CpaF family protein [Bosea massiliensis]|uniref:CpaF family protein n=1 Tax=Bosea massiliensis TaxID=151419 RepID=A0ABW0P280_9HYPH